ncbi:MAG: alanine--tRNA ligase [Bacteroidetes bacterium]|nr:alanine--tRNA ligase [Bacteroidota bacterium]MBS1630293.1 alanine--tRNA ligase [Bacteroidota bacterium]
MTASDIRRVFLDFFKSKGHLIVPSAPLVVKDDPTLLFVNSGMAPFKDAFLGNRPAPAARVADTQKCLRVSGKHNDLEEVGVDTYHHTLFEMLGNWSFGDYFKKEAIAWSWELLTERYGIPKEQLYVTVFGGDAAEGLPRDDEALNFWKEHLAESRILMGSKKDNFWEMGDTGPCGPCTEIHVDTRPAAERADGRGAALVNADHPQVIEIWNNVFMQFNRQKDGSLVPLPARHVDTGMGFERLVRVLQGKQSNYDTDVFSGSIAAIARITGRSYPAPGDAASDIAFRVLADHIRAIAFSISDGQLPANTGAGYVIRRILRRAVRYYYSCLDYRQPLLFQLVPVVSAQFEAVFPELKQQEDFVSRVVREEEEAFLRTLEKGLRRLDELMVAAAATRTIAGAAAFELFDTYGFPIDLTRLIAAEKNYQVDEAGFEKGLQEQKARSRAATALDTDDWVLLREGNTRFVGYERLQAETEVLRYRRVKAKGKQSYQLVLAETPFYAESGGQVGDQGVLQGPQGSIRIYDTRKENDLILHYAEQLPGELSGPLTAQVDAERRAGITVHHSATHLMHAALRQVLGKHVVQKGSLVNEEHLRFDFAHFARMTEEEIEAVERLVNKQIRANLPVVIRQMPKEEAMALGAMALFGEKYGEQVRVVAMDPDYSMELCGGTHVGHTGALGCFKIRTEGAVAAGVRRIEALSGAAAEAYVQSELKALRAARQALKNPKDLAQSIEALQAESALLRKRLEGLEAQQMTALARELAGHSERLKGLQYVGEVVQVPSAEALRKLALELLTRLGKGAVVLLSAALDTKATVVLALSEEAQQQGLDAASLIRQVVAPQIKGGGGGNKALATAGGTLTEALSELKGGMKAELERD